MNNKSVWMSKDKNRIVTEEVFGFACYAHVEGNQYHKVFNTENIDSCNDWLDGKTEDEIADRVYMKHNQVMKEVE